jgi:hypothetical protein
MKGTTATTTPANRFVVGPDSQGRSAVLQRGLTNVQSQEATGPPASHWRSHPYAKLINPQRQ